ncbi:MAG: DUF3836 domain-containing protein [Flavobacteriaceae bacterium]
MKKITLLLFCFAFSLVFAQDKLEVSIKQWYDGSSWINNEKEEYTYSTNGNLTEINTFVWNLLNSNWEEWTKTMLTYNANNNMVTETYQNWNGTVFENGYKMEYSHDANDNNLGYIDYSWNGTDWVVSSKLEIIYSGSNPVSGTYSEWNSDSSSWEEVETANLTFSEGKLIQDITSEYGEETYKSIYTYNGSGYRTQIAYQEKNDSGIWETTETENYSYDANNNRTETTFLYSEGGYKNTYTFDTAEQLNNYIHPFNYLFLG